MCMNQIILQAFILQWHGGIGNPATLLSPPGTHQFPGMDPSPRSPISHSSSSGCVNLGRSSSTSFPYFQNWKFDYSSNLRPKTKSKLYLILDFINGGHLFFHLYRQGIFSEDQAWIYTAEIVSAISHLHKSGIVHRDLKPENILMDVDGHVMTTMPST